MDNKIALFTNFTDQEFIGHWNGKAKKFAPSESIYLPDYLARHYAKHLVNRELLREKRDKHGKIVRELNVEGRQIPVLVYVNGDSMTSPKFPEQVPVFMELFNRAYKSEGLEGAGSSNDNLDASIEIANKNNGGRGSVPVKTGMEDKEPQVVLSPEDDEDEEESFKGKPKE